MPPRRLVLLFALLAASLALSAQLPRGGDLGKRWKAKEWTPSFNMEGFWVRCGTSNEFDTTYTDVKTRQNLYWRVVILAVEGSQVRMKATLNLGDGQKTFDVTGRLLGDGRTIRGRGGWCAPSQTYCGFEVVTDWSVAQKEYTQFSRPGPLMGRDKSEATAPRPRAPRLPASRNCPRAGASRTTPFPATPTRAIGASAAANSASSTRAPPAPGPTASWSSKPGTAP